MMTYCEAIDLLTVTNDGEGILSTLDYIAEQVAEAFVIPETSDNTSPSAPSVDGEILYSYSGDGDSLGIFHY